MPLATSMAMMSLDCRSISLFIDTSLKQQPLSDGSMAPANHTHSTLHRSISQSIKTAPGHTASGTLQVDR